MGRFLQWRQATIKLPQQLPQRLMSCVVHVVNFTSKKHINSFFSICWLWSVMGLTSSLLQLERKNSWTSQKHTATSSDSPLMLVSWKFPGSFLHTCDYTRSFILIFSVICCLSLLSFLRVPRWPTTGYGSVPPPSSMCISSRWLPPILFPASALFYFINWNVCELPTQQWFPVHCFDSLLLM